MSTNPRVSFHVTGVALLSADGQLVTVRKRGTGRFMLPGGKIEPGESAAAAGARECEEELGIVLDAERLEFLFEAVVPAANEPGEWIHSTVFVHAAPDRVEPLAEIEEVRMLRVDRDLPEDLAPLIRDRLVPFLRERRQHAL